MKKLSSLTVFVLVVLYAIGGKAQDLPTIISPSPNAASLGEYANTPVSYYSGRSNISIPLYDITSGEIKLPISINYDASGIKVSQEASWVGLGWSLNAGGVITRQINDEDDFSSKGYTNNSGNLPDYTVDGCPDFSSQQKIDAYNNFGATLMSNSNETKPDIYFYNFFGNTGKLLIQKQIPISNEYMATPIEQNNLKFIYNRSAKAWTIIDANGWKYFMGEHEITETNSLSSPTPQFYDEIQGQTAGSDPIITAWFIDKVITPKGDEIMFIYDTDRHYNIGQVNYSERHSYFLPTPYLQDYDPDQYSASMQIVDDVYLKRIEFSNGYINFTSENREDIRKQSIHSNAPDPQRLKAIEVFNNNNESIKKIDFKYSYFSTPTSGGNPENSKRLRLDEVEESFKPKNSSSYLSKPSYKLEYNSTPLPKKTSFSVDHWGYYNGKDNDNVIWGIGNVELDGAIDYINTVSVKNVMCSNSSSISRIKTLSPRLPWFSILHYDGKGADRDVDTTYVKAGMLESIQYPTGGLTTFEFESNTYSNYGVYSGIPIYEYEEKTHQVGYNAGSSQGQSAETIFTLSESTLVYFNCLVPFYSAPDDIKISLQNTSNGYDIMGFLKPQTYSGNFICDLRSWLPAGTYRLKVESMSNSGSLLMLLKATYLERTLKDKTFGGGLRIKSIETKESPSVTQPSKKKTFVYEENGLSNGQLVLPLNYNGHSPIGTYDIVSNTIRPLGTSSFGNTIGYDKVIEKDEDLNNNFLGSTTFFFKNQPSFGPQWSQIPGVPAFSLLDNGQLQKIEYRNSSGVLVEEKITNYTEEVVERKIIPAAFFYFRLYEPNLTACEHAYYYNFKSEWWHPDNETITTYDLNGNNPITIVTNYEYNSTLHKNITKITTTDSKGEAIASNMEYPSDYPVGTGMSIPTFDAMVTDNIINPIIKQTTTLNGTLLSTQINIYKDWDVDNDNAPNDPDDILLPELMKSAKGTITTSNPLQDKIEFVKYDEQGQVLEVKQIDGTPVCYVWGYNEEYPIAKIENAIYSEIASQVSNLQSKSNLDNDRTIDIINSNGSITKVGNEGDLREALRSLRNSLPNAMVTTYTYDPLIGVTSMTDPKGYTMYYEYDAFNRLEFVKDADGNLVSENKYNYKN